MTSFATLSAWGWLIQFFIIVVALLVANLIRCNVPLFKRSLLPSALLAGLLILCLKPFGFSLHWSTSPPWRLSPIMPSVWASWPWP